MASMSNLFPTQELRDMDAAHHIHPFSVTKDWNAEGVRVITNAEGVWLTDSEGQTYIDGMSGLWCVQVGYGRQEIIEAANKQMEQLAYYNTFFKTTNAPAAQLSQKLAELAPDSLSHVFYTNSGSEANDTAWRLSRHYWNLKGKPNKKIFISRKYAYHGSTLAGTLLGGMQGMHDQGGSVGTAEVVHIDPPYWYGEGGDQDAETFGMERAAQLEKMIEKLGPDNVAAFIGEPIQGAGGVIIPPASYWPEIQRICRKYDILLIVDEVICGFGRTGKWFGCETFGITPDLMPIAKGLSSGYMPIGGVMISDRVAEVVIESREEFYHGYTYSGHPVACAAALANLNILQSENIVENAAQQVAPYLQQQWRTLAEHPVVGEARMCGLIGALELTPDKAHRAPFPNTGDVGDLCRDHCFDAGLVMRAVRDTMVAAPPLTITHDEIDILIARAHVALDRTYEDLKRQGHL